MNFKYSAFTENTPEAREWLRSIDYTISCGHENKHDYIYTYNKNGYAFSTWKAVLEDMKSYQSGNLIDCRSNFELFRAVTAIRDDSDYMQWFVDPCGYWYRDPFDMDGMRKATLDELINKFK